MWTLHHVNWYRILWWADGLESINAEDPSAAAAAAAHSPEWAGHAAAGKQTVTLLRKTCLSTKQQCTILSFSA